jgi:hypothetical protein
MYKDVQSKDLNYAPSDQTPVALRLDHLNFYFHEKNSIIKLK